MEILRRWVVLWNIKNYICRNRGKDLIPSVRKESKERLKKRLHQPSSLSGIRELPCLGNTVRHVLNMVGGRGRGRGGKPGKGVVKNIFTGLAPTKILIDCGSKSSSRGHRGLWSSISYGIYARTSVWVWTLREGGFVRNLLFSWSIH